MAVLYTGIDQLLTFAGDKAPRAGAAMRETGKAAIARFVKCPTS